MSFAEGMKRIIKKIKDANEIRKMDKSVSEFQKMRETVKKINSKKVGAK
jgi:hypothetical protein